MISSITICIHDHFSSNISRYIDIKNVIMITAGLFWADGCLCVLFALLAHLKYSRSAKRLICATLAMLAVQNRNTQIEILGEF